MNQNAVRNNEMKNIIQRYVLLLSLMVSGRCFSQSIDSPYEVGTWQGFRSGAVSFTFDDGCSNQFAVALPMFNQYGFKMTLFTVINWGPNWTALQAAASNGHEIASHTMSHAKFDTTSYADQNTELKNSQDAINSHISGQKCITIAYPNCVMGNSALCNTYYMAARGCSGVVEPSTPANFMNISSLVCGTMGSVKTALDFKTKADAAAASKGWVVFLLHGIDNDGGYSPVTSANLKGALDSLNSHKEKYWVATFGNVARYIKERNCVSVKEISSMDSMLVVRITDTLDNSIYNCPVTIRRPLPQNWTSASVIQNSKALDVQLVTVNSVKYVMVDVVPDSGDITIKKNDLTDVSGSNDFLPGHPHLMQNYPNPFNPSTIIKYHLSASTHVKLKVYTLFGQEVESLTSGYQSAGEHEITWQPNNLASGIYVYRLYTGAFSETRKLVLLK
jgi:peptidoglycan-N-acetylglucosamine deacetylase